MNYSVKVTRLDNEKEGNIKGFAKLVLGEGFKIANIAILENKQTKELYVSMPRYKSNELDENGKNIYKNICNPITAKFREELFGNIMNAYESIGTDSQEKNAELEIKGQDEEMKITATVSAYEKKGSNMKGVARVYFDDVFIVNNLSIMDGKWGMYLSMPAYKTKQVDEEGKAIYQSICYPVSKEVQGLVYDTIMGEYEKVRGGKEGKGLESSKEKTEGPFR